jgi:tRNA(Ile)-lysidine synthase
MGTNPSPWTVRMARPSDRFRPGTAGRTRTLKNLFQEGGVPTWVRERTPLLALDEKPVWVGGFGWSVEGTAAASVRALDIAWRHDLPGAPHRP